MELTTPSSDSNVFTLCRDAEKAIRSLLSTTFQHVRDGDARSEFDDVQNLLLIKSMELNTLRQCLDQATKDFTDLKKQEAVIVRNCSVAKRRLPTLPTEITIYILSLAFHNPTICLSDIYRAINRNEETRDFANILKALEPRRHLKRLFLSSVACYISAADSNGLYTLDNLRNYLTESRPMKFSVKFDYSVSRLDNIGRNLRRLLRSPGRWKEIYIKRDDVGDSICYLKRCIPVLRHIDNFTFLADIYNSNLGKVYLDRINKMFPNLLGDRVAKLRSATIQLCYLKPFVSSGFFNTVTRLELWLGLVKNSELIHVHLCILSELKNLSSLTLVSQGAVYEEDDCPLQLPSLKALNLRSLEPLGTMALLTLFGRCGLDEVSLEAGYGAGQRLWSKALEAAPQIISLLHDRFPGLSGLALDWNLDAVVALLSEPSQDNVWRLPALRSLKLSGEVDAERLVAMLRARISAPEVAPINHMEVQIPMSKDEEIKGSHMLALHELDKLVPNVVRLTR